MAPKFRDLLSESNRIINSQPRHYLNLYLIFLLPLSFISLIFQLIFKHLQQQPPTKPSIITILSILFFLISCIFSYGAVITITYSIFHAFFNRPVKLKEAIKSFTTSFFPLLATHIITSTLYFFISFFLICLIGLVFGLVLFLITYLGDIDLLRVITNPYLVAIVSMLVILPLILYLEVNLILVRVVVVVESRSGLEPLKRSWKLVKGMKWLGFLTIFLFGSLQMILAWISSYSWVLIFVVSPIPAVLSLYYIAACTLLYIYCKEKHGEVEEVEFGKEKDEANLSLIPIL